MSKNKVIFSINILGLGIGIASCLLIMLFVTDELSYDRFNEKADEIVRVVFKAEINGNEVKEATVMAPVGQTLKNEFPEVEQATRIRTLGSPKIIHENETYRDGNVAYVDPNFFEVFSLPVLKGDAVSPLQEPYSAVIPKKEAEKYFGSIESAIGKVLQLEGYEQPYTVTAVIDEIPKTSHFNFDAFLSMEGYGDAKSTSWTSSNYYTYLVLKKGHDHRRLESKLPQIMKKYMGPQIQEKMGLSYAEFTKKNKIGFFLQPLTEIHFDTAIPVAPQFEKGGDIKYIYIFSAVALFMLLIACINFMNLSTAAAAKRAKEVGIKKVLGSKKGQLIRQFLSESFIATLTSVGVAGILLIVSLPLSNSLSGKQLELSYLLTPAVFSVLLLLMMAVSLFAGSYPAFYLSSFKPISALKSRFYGKGNTKGIRSGLVVFQFVISAGLIFATLTVNEQMSFIQNKELGYDKDQLLVIREASLLGHKTNAFKDEIEKNPRVTNVTRSSYVPAGPTDTSSGGIYEDNQLKRKMSVYHIDEDYIPTMGMELTAGRNFSRDFGSDSTTAIINESAVKSLGLGKDPLGKTFVISANNREPLIVIGVVKDFHFQSLHRPIEPLVMLKQVYGGLIVKARTSEMAGLVKDLEEKWNAYASNEPFRYTLLDDSYRQTYLTEEKMGALLNIFALLTIFVACLGLFGLVTFTVEQKFKEIGIRKVLGSSVAQVVGMLTKDFLKLVLISILIAFPVGHYFMDRWLQDFAYRIEIRWWIFVLTGLLTVLIAFLTISYKSIRAANANPIKSLRTE
ncbi:ABC transporter permease [Flagellimonas sp.]|uniref:ABC transporter permease n=1 Tax=Flagellimonas sp. TaxID=2058762 RepID=UPI003B50596F